MQRRTFLRSTLAAGLAAHATSLPALARMMGSPSDSQVPRRKYRDDVHLSIIGFGSIVLLGHSHKESAEIVAEAVDRGVNYFDVAPSYGDGEAEEKLGPALQPHRSNAFLACKTMEREAAGARKELERSLKRLKTDHFDLYQLHAVTTDEDVEQIFAPGGALEAYVKAREEGKVRYLGFSAHSEKAALALMDGFNFDSLLFPINFVCFGEGDFGPRVLKRAQEKGVARLALKAMAHTPWPEGAKQFAPKCWYRPVEDMDLARRALRFTLSQDITAAIPPGEEQYYRAALDAAAQFTPLTREEQADMLARAKGLTPLFRT